MFIDSSAATAILLGESDADELTLKLRGASPPLASHWFVMRQHLQSLAPGTSISSAPRPLLSGCCSFTDFVALAFQKT